MKKKTVPKPRYIIPGKKKYTLFNFFILGGLCCSLLGACNNSRPVGKEISIKNGELDLSTWDFNKDGPVKLNGAWKFRWLASAPEYKEKDFDASGWQDYEVPGYWNTITGNKYGFGWFRLKIINIQETELGIYLIATHTAYELYADGELVLHNGSPGNSRQETIPERVPKDALLPRATSLTLAWKISNFYDIAGGCGNAPVIGKPADLKAAYLKAWITDAFVLGIIAIMSFYHLILWLLRKKDKASFYFALVCQVIIIRTIIINYHLLDIFPFLTWHEVHTKLDLLSAPLIWFCIDAFFTQLFPDEFMKIPYLVFLSAALLFVIIIIFTPSWIYMLFLLPYYGVVILAGSWLIIMVIRAVIHGRQGAVIILLATVTFFVAALNDIVYSNYPALTRPLIQVGLVVFIAAQSVVLALRFTSAYHTAEHLSHNLKKEVERTTATISRQNLELTRLNQEKTLFFINLAHELKTPLTLINNYLDKYIKAKGSNEDAGIIQENFQKLKNDVVNFLDYEKIIRGRVLYSHTDVIALPGFLEKKIVLFKAAAQLKGITITSNIEKELFIKMDPAALDRVVNNLLDNAVKYTGKNGEIHIDLAGGVHEVKLAIRDNGIGIPADAQAHLFEPYYQASRNKSSNEGMGIGLNLVRKIMDEVGGKINLCSQESQGTMIMLQFEKYLPGAGETITGEYSGSIPVFAGRIPPLPGEQFDKDKKSILIVEDNSAMLYFLQNNLCGKYNVFCAHDGQDALNRLDMIPVPDLILSDIMMDVMDGVVFHKRIMQMEKYKSIPFIFLTAKTSKEEKIAGLDSGAVDFISKPFDLPELQARIKSLLELQDALRSQNTAEIEERILDVIHKPLPAADNHTDFEKNCALFQLSQREKEVLRLIFQARDNKEIAAMLNISYPTVRTHIQHIFKKCGVANKVELLKIFKKF